MSYVYFIQQGEDGPIKIGKSHDPHERLAQLQTGSAYELRLLGFCVESPGRDESSFHEKFAEHHLRGEWFNMRPEIYSEATELGTPNKLEEIARLEAENLMFHERRVAFRAGWRVHVPYVITHLEGATYAVLNRHYKPVGMITEEWVDYKLHATLINDFTPVLQRKISFNGKTFKEGKGSIALYNDGGFSTYGNFGQRLQLLRDLIEGSHPDAYPPYVEMERDEDNWKFTEKQTHRRSAVGLEALGRAYRETLLEGKCAPSSSELLGKIKNTPFTRLCDAGTAHRLAKQAGIQR